MKGIEKDFIDTYQQCSSMFGQDDVLATVFATLYIEPEEMSMDDLTKKTGYSLASISNKIKMLEAMGIVSKRKHPGSKKIFLYAEKDLIKMIKNTMLVKEKQMIGAFKEKLPGIIKKHKNSSKSEKEEKKVKIVEDYYKQMIKMEELLIKMREELDKIDK